MYDFYTSAFLQDRDPVFPIGQDGCLQRPIGSSFPQWAFGPHGFQKLQAVIYTKCSVGQCDILQRNFRRQEDRHCRNPNSNAICDCYPRQKTYKMATQEALNTWTQDYAEFFEFTRAREMYPSSGGREH